MATFVGQIMVNSGPHWGTLCSQPNYLLKMVSPHFCGDILQRFRLVKPLYENGRNRGTTNQRGILYSQSTISIGKKWFWGPLNPYDHMGMAQKTQCWMLQKSTWPETCGFSWYPFFFIHRMKGMSWFRNGDGMRDMGGWTASNASDFDVNRPWGCLACQPPGRIQVSIIRFFRAHVM